MKKDWTRSKTILINGASAVITLIVMLATLFAGPEVAQFGISPEIARDAAIVLLVANVVNLWLRSVTTQPVRLPGQAGEAGTLAARRLR
jgi:hypothetical protein